MVMTPPDYRGQVPFPSPRRAPSLPGARLTPRPAPRPEPGAAGLLPPSLAWNRSDSMGPSAAYGWLAEYTRKFVVTTLRLWGLSVHRDTAELVMSELAGNAIKASADPEYPEQPRRADGHVALIKVGMSTDGGAVLVWAWDQAAGLPGKPAADPGLDGENGRGLFIVESLAAAIGCYWYPGIPGKTVWALLEPET